MPPKINRAKIELHLFTLLEKANREFSTAWKNCQNPNKKQESFQNCAQSYEKIIELIEHNREKNNISDLLQSYYLEACLGKIQSHLNDLPQNPSNEDVVLSNDKKIKKLTKSLTRLNSQVKALNLHGKKNIAHALRKDYRDLFNKINEYFLSWEITSSRHKATYYYNFAEKLFKESKNLSSITNYHDYKHKKNLLSTSIMCLGISRDFYKKLNQQQDTNLTTQRINYIQLKLDKVFKEFKPLKESFAKQKSSDTKRKSSDPSEAPNSKKSKVTPIIEESIGNLSRKSTETAEPEAPSNKKSYISPSQINVTTSILLQSEEEMVQQKEDQFKKMLTQIPANDSFRFYGGLFFSLSQKLQICSKESSNHTFLTKLSWLTLAKELIGLTSNKNAADNTDIQKIATKITSLSTANQKNLKTISSQKRAEAYPTYTDLQDRDLQNLFIEEVTDYYYGLEAFNLKSVAMNFLDSIPNLIKEKSFTRLIEDTINNVGKPTENLFYANLLRELVKFHICDENEHWRNNTFSSEKRINLTMNI
ncbi:MAG: hypothetical protein RJA83_439 [Pseudomonadota bacterium]|jgi:hypothetical protein